MADITKSPRMFVDGPLSEGMTLNFAQEQHHYLRNVMRMAESEPVRVFNGKDGEFIARIERIDKRHVEATVENRIREQHGPRRRIHLLVAPIRKERFDWIIEKAVELCATDIHPVLTQNTDVRKINEDRIHDQVIEAAEQCERLDMPALHPVKTLHDVFAAWDSAVPVFAAIERMGIAPVPRGVEHDCALLVGPAGGFTLAEKEELVSYSFVTPVSLGKNILRTETAVAAGLSLLTL